MVLFPVGVAVQSRIVDCVIWWDVQTINIYQQFAVWTVCCKQASWLRILDGCKCTVQDTCLWTHAFSQVF